MKGQKPAEAGGAAVISDEGAKAIEELDAYMADEIKNVEKNAVEIGAGKFGCGPV